jgi:cytochrome c-type biogenesis protein CcmF
MLPELGHFAIILALCFALTQAVTAGLARVSFYQRMTNLAIIGQFSFLSFAMLCLIISFLNNDMTVIYVQEHSHQLLPFIYRIGAAWGGHEGSLLLWCLILSGWTLVFLLFSSSLRKNSPRFFYYIMMTLGIISSGFILFLWLTSNPFARIFLTEPIVGNDLTPILQDPGLIFHPPMLYFGYVGFAIGFAFAIAALFEKRFEPRWAQACRPWIILPWACLSCGIVLGSWWAYRELGWGGWWFWDPVENASLLPWLAATALIHSLIVSEKRQVFLGWTLLLAIITFALSLLGTFLVRSGVLISVHAFANDPQRGVFLLAFLALIIGGSLTCYAFRIRYFYKPPSFQLLSRETFLLMNSVILLTAVATIVIGTFYPILLDAFNYKISVGEPYFNTVFVPIILPLLLLMGAVPHVHWGKQSFKSLWKKLNPIFYLSILLALFLPWIFEFPIKLLTTIGLFLGLWVSLVTLQSIYLLSKTHSLNLSRCAMIVAHLGIAIIVLGITINKSYSVERQIRILPGETISFAGYQFTFSRVEKITGPNYQSMMTWFTIQKNLKTLGTLSPEQRNYSHDSLLNKPAILVNPWRDLYLALGNSFTDGSWSIRLYYKPLVRWIWCGGFMLLIGGLLSLLSHLKHARHGSNP